MRAEGEREGRNVRHDLDAGKRRAGNGAHGGRPRGAAVETKDPSFAQTVQKSVVGNAVDSALAEHGVTDPNVCKAVKNKLLERGEEVLARATGLKALDDFLATVKAGTAIRDFKIGQTFE